MSTNNGQPTSTTEYEVIKPFKYGGKVLAIGEDWGPTGGPYDALLIAQEKFIKPKRDAVADRAEKVKHATARLDKVRQSTRGRRKKASKE